MWPSLAARFKASFDEADRIQSEVGIRFCRPLVRCASTHFPTEPCTASSMLPALPGVEGKRRRRSFVPPWRWKSRTASARVRGRRRRWLRPPGGRDSVMHPPASSCGGNRRLHRNNGRPPGRRLSGPCLPFGVLQIHTHRAQRRH